LPPVILAFLDLEEMVMDNFIQGAIVKMTTKPRLPKRTHWLLVSLLCLSACGSDNSTKSSAPPTGIISPSLPPQALPLPDNRQQRPMTVLWFGNSHTHGHSLPAVVSRLLKAGAGIDAQMTVAPGYWFLDERWQLAADQQLIQSKNWTAVVLQAQKYSTTGQFVYSTQETQQWIALAKSLKIMPVLYPEHPRAGNQVEGQRVYQLHLTIAALEPACVAPVGPLWDEQRRQTPTLSLHEPDGNHFNAEGALLTAYLFYELLSGQPASALPDLPELPVAINSQQQLRRTVSAISVSYPACRF